MKTMKYLSMMLFMVIASVCFSACGDDDDDPVKNSPSIIGKWQQINNAGTVITITFNNDRTGVINYVYPDNVGDENENFEYDYINENRNLTIVGSQLRGKYYVTITATQLLLSTIEEKEEDVITYSFSKI